MKLSEILAKPIKVKGGGTVNLKGLSKHIVDKEIEGDDNNAKFPIGEKILDFFNKNLISHPSKFAVAPETSDLLEDINDFDGEPITGHLLYKKSDIDAFLDLERMVYLFTYDGYSLTYSTSLKKDLDKKIYIIDNVSYYALYDKLV